MNIYQLQSQAKLHDWESMETRDLMERLYLIAELRQCKPVALRRIMVVMGVEKAAVAMQLLCNKEIWPPQYKERAHERESNVIPDRSDI